MRHCVVDVICDALVLLVVLVLKEARAMANDARSPRSMIVDTGDIGTASLQVIAEAASVTSAATGTAGC
jgi:hypothetical protein